MSTRQLTTNRQTIVGINKTIPQRRIRQAFLVVGYDGWAREVLVQFTDPARVFRGVAVKVQIRTGLILPLIPAGSSITIGIEHGQLTVIGL
jgi:hypothetical protein